MFIYFGIKPKTKALEPFDKKAFKIACKSLKKNFIQAKRYEQSELIVNMRINQRFLPVIDHAITHQGIDEEDVTRWLSRYAGLSFFPRKAAFSQDETLLTALYKLTSSQNDAKAIALNPHFSPLEAKSHISNSIKEAALYHVLAYRKLDKGTYDNLICHLLKMPALEGWEDNFRAVTSLALSEEHISMSRFKVLEKLGVYDEWFAEGDVEVKTQLLAAALADGDPETFSFIVALPHSYIVNIGKAELSIYVSPQR